MTDRELIQSVYNVMRVLFSPEVPIMVLLRERLERDE